MGGRAPGVAMLVAGAAMATSGVVLLVTDDSGPSTTNTDRPAATTTTSPTTTSSPTTTTTAVPTESPESFFARWTEALAAGDAAFLVDRLHPATFERYERSACEAYLGAVSAPQAAAEVLAVGLTGTWEWTTDGISRQIPGATTVRLRRTEDGDTYIENDTHVVIGEDGLVRWFTDCGTPRDGAV